MVGRPAPYFPRGRHEENHRFRFPVRRRLHGGSGAGADRRARQPEFQYPSVRSKDGSLSPPSTLRITVTGEAGAQAPAAIGDTPASRSEYERCRRVSDRAAVSNAQMQTGVAQCLRELEQRRQQQ